MEKENIISSIAKRGNGEGSVYRRKSDGKWVGNVF